MNPLKSQKDLGDYELTCLFYFSQRKVTIFFFFLTRDVSSLKWAQLIQLDLPSRQQRTGIFLTFLKHESNCTHPYLELLHLEAIPSHISRLFQATVLTRTVTTLIVYKLLATEVVCSLFLLSLVPGISCPLCLLLTCMQKKSSNFFFQPFSENQLCFPLHLPSSTVLKM